MVRGEGESEDAWPEEEPPFSDWCRALMGSRRKPGARVVAGRAEGKEGKGGDGKEEGEERAEVGDWTGVNTDSESTVMAGQGEEEAEEGKVIRGAEADEEPDPDWPFDCNGPIMSDFDN